MYIDQRSTGTHGVFLLNSHGLDIVQRDGVIEWRIIGGTLDFYFISGPTPIKVVEQYSEISGTPQQMPDWSFGFQLCRWGYTSLAETRSVVDRMRAANIPLEVQYNDIDWMHAYRNFEFDPNFSPDEYRSFIQYLTDNHQHYIPIIDAAYAVPRNDTDVYNSYTRGAELDVWLKNPDGTEYRGRVWPGGGDLRLTACKLTKLITIHCRCHRVP
jgi:alpha-glucosidase